jgi:hypothetical protein
MSFSIHAPIFVRSKTKLNFLPLVAVVVATALGRTHTQPLLQSPR